MLILLQQELLLHLRPLRCLTKTQIYNGLVFFQLHISDEQNKCSVGPETSISPREKGQGPTSFSERGLFFSEIGQLSDRV